MVTMYRSFIVLSHFYKKDPPFGGSGYCLNPISLLNTHTVWANVRTCREERREAVEAVGAIDGEAVEFCNFAVHVEVFEEERGLRCILRPRSRVARFCEADREVRVQGRLMR